MPTQHRLIPEAQLHEPKGVSTAAINKLYKSNGAGSGVWDDVDSAMLQGLTGDGAIVDQMFLSNGANGFKLGRLPRGSMSFVNIATPLVITNPLVATKIAAVTVAGPMPYAITAGTNARLTYTGATAQHFHIAVTISVDQTAAAGRDIELYVALNGVIVPRSTVTQTTAVTTKVSTAIHTDLVLATNDYLELFVKITGTGDVRVYTLDMFMMGMSGV